MPSYAEWRGPHPWNNPANKVGYVEAIMGCRPWDQSSEARASAPCGVCAATRVIDPGFVCLGCLRVAKYVQAKLIADRWPSTEPPKERKPLTKKQKKKLLDGMTRKERRSLLFAARGTEDGQRWLKELGLKAAS